MSSQKTDAVFEKSVEIRKAVVDAHRIGSLGSYGAVEVDIKTGEIHVSQYASSRSCMRGCITIYDNENKCWEECMDLDYVCVGDMYIIQARNLYDEFTGKPATEYDIEISHLTGNLRALTESEMYDEIDWSVVLADKFDTAIEAYRGIRGVHK